MKKTKSSKKIVLKITMSMTAVNRAWGSIVVVVVVVTIQVNAEVITIFSIAVWATEFIKVVHVVIAHVTVKIGAPELEGFSQTGPM